VTQLKRAIAAKTTEDEIHAFGQYVQVDDPEGECFGDTMWVTWFSP
jgi:hypothetical protein